MMFFMLGRICLLSACAKMQGMQGWLICRAPAETKITVCWPLKCLRLVWLLCSMWRSHSVEPWFLNPVPVLMRIHHLAVYGLASHYNHIRLHDSLQHAPRKPPSLGICLRYIFCNIRGGETFSQLGLGRAASGYNTPSQTMALQTSCSFQNCI